MKTRYEIYSSKDREIIHFNQFNLNILRVGYLFKVWLGFSDLFDICESNSNKFPFNLEKKLK